MKLLALAYDLPPTLRPQAIQIGRLLQHWPTRDSLFVATADDHTAGRDPHFYPQLAQRFAGHLVRPYPQAPWRRVLRKAWSLAWPVPDVFLRWNMATARAIEEQWGDQRFDRLLTFACPMSACVAGEYLARRLNIPWTALLSDPWADNPYFHYHALAAAANRRLEARTITAARQIIVPSDEMRLALIKRYPHQAGKFAVLPHSFDPALYPRCGPPNEPLLLRYIGHFYGSRSAETLLAGLGQALAAQRISADDLRLELIGGMPARYQRRYQAQVQQYQLHNVVNLTGSVPYLTSLEKMRSADVLVLIDAALPGSVYFPSKLADYLGAARPILAITPSDGAAARIMRETRAGWLVPPDQPEQIATALVELVARRQQNRLAEHTAPADSLRRYRIDHNAPLLREMICG